MQQFNSKSENMHSAEYEWIRLHVEIEKIDIKKTK